MKSIYEPSTLQELLDRIDKLHPDTQRLWGKMDVAQMMAHCSSAIEIAIGDRVGKSTLMGTLVGRFAKSIITNEKPFKKNLPTAPDFVVVDSKDFNKEKVRLTVMLKRLSSGGADAMHNRKHHFFGRLTSHEWSNSMYKHMDHHLRQFGV
jgi:hypothetical protein